LRKSGGVKEDKSQDQQNKFFHKQAVWISADEGILQCALQFKDFITEQEQKKSG
jgi:hypothetical protein